MKTYRRILSYARPLRKHLPQYVLFTLLSIIFGLLNFTLLKPLFDVLFQQIDQEALAALQKPPSFSLTIDYFTTLFNYYFKQAAESYDKSGALFFVCIVIVCSVFLSNLFKYLGELTLASIRAKLILKMRNHIFEVVTRLHLGFFTDERKGDLMSRITNDVQEVEHSIVNSLRVIFREPATIIIYFAALFTMSFQLTIFTLVLLPVSGIIISEITKRLKRKAQESQESLGRIVNILDEVLSGMRIVKAFNARQFVLKKFGKEVEHYSRLDMSMARKNELASPASEFMGVTVVAGILLYGGSMVLQDQSELSASQFITYIIIFSQILTPAKALSNGISRIQRGLASAERIFSVVDTQSKIQEPSHPVKKDQFDDSIEFKKVSFRYQSEKVLKGVSLSIQKGQVVALVGPSGGGKSTLADLVPRFYDPSEGEICIDGIPIKEIGKENLRSLMGIVTQESILFNDTVYNNIAFAKLDAQQEEVEHAAKIANAHDFIIEMPEGYQSSIGERGSRLSGGQRQRISIARAILKNPSILILDEATSALDSESEKLVQDALNKLMENRTSIIIAHRLSTIQHADKIVVLEKGKIIEMGTHKELMESPGLYFRLNKMQNT